MEGATNNKQVAISCALDGKSEMIVTGLTGLTGTFDWFDWYRFYIYIYISEGASFDGIIKPVPISNGTRFIFIFIFRKDWL